LIYIKSGMPPPLKNQWGGGLSTDKAELDTQSDLDLVAVLQGVGPCDLATVDVGSVLTPQVLQDVLTVCASNPGVIAGNLTLHEHNVAILAASDGHPLLPDEPTPTGSLALLYDQGGHLDLGHRVAPPVRTT
jgi:hypothetical protein